MYTSEDAEDIYWGEHPDFDSEPIAEVDLGSRRWNHDWRRIMRRTADGTFWAVEGQIALTEMQENIFEEDPVQVFAREVEIPPVPATIETHFFIVGVDVACARTATKPA